jgi:hypothetical protein
VKQFSFYAGVSAAVAAVAAVVVAVVPASEASRSAAWLGVGLATASGAVALLLKRQTMSIDGLDALTSGIKTLAMVMSMRAMLLTAGLVWVARHNDGALGFVCGFFSVYLGQQWLEISYLLAEQKRHSQLRKVQTP